MLHMVEVMQRDFNEHHMTQVPMTENQLEEMLMMEKISDHVGMNYPEIPDSRFVAQPVDDFLFPSSFLVPMTENQLEEMQMMEEVSDHVGMNYPEIPDSRFVAQPVDNFLFPWEEVGLAENPITIDEDEGFSETMTPPAPQQPPAMEPRPDLRSIENLQNSSAVRQLLD